MKLVVQVKLLPSPGQAEALKATLRLQRRGKQGVYRCVRDDLAPQL